MANPTFKIPRDREYVIERSIPEPNSGCWLWTQAWTPTGYGQCHNRNASRVSFEAHFGEVPDGLYVLHRCDTRACVNPDHLFLGTPQDNSRDMVSKGRHANNCKPKLTAAQVIEIRASPGSQAAIARRFGVTQANVSFIKRRVTWSTIPDDTPGC